MTLDEPENHLHPGLQRTLLPNLLSAFPSAQIVVSTHSPFVASSVKDSFVYALCFDDNQKVSQQRLETRTLAGTADEILRDVLGLPETMPVWVGAELELILKKYRKVSLTAARLKKLKSELRQIGLDEHIPDSIATLFLERSHAKNY